MANLTSVGITSGIPTLGTGTVSTLDALMADGGQITLGSKADAKNSATDTTPISTISILKQISSSVQGSGGRSSTGTQTSVSSSATDVTVLASNSLRLGGSVYNDSTVTLYVLCASGTSSTSLYTVQIAPNSYFEIPFNYTGVLKGLWASATGNARVTEYTA